MKKFLMFILVFVLAFSFFGCNTKRTVKYDPEDISEMEIIFYETYEEYEKGTGKSFPIDESKKETVLDLARRLDLNENGTDQPSMVPGYKVKFKSGGISHYFYIDADNHYHASFLENSNNFSYDNYTFYPDIEKLFNESNPESKDPSEIAESIGYMTFEEITASGYYPDWMQPHTVIIYDENGVPEITEGGELTPDDLLGRPEFESGVPFTSVGIEGSEMEIEPNTKVEYDLHGFIQNIYHLWPDGTYNLDYPPDEG